jgi:hypothetical protein
MAKNKWKPVAWEDIRAGDVVRLEPFGSEMVVEHIGNRYLKQEGHVSLRFRYMLDDMFEEYPKFQYEYQRLEEVEETPQDCPFCGSHSPNTEKIGFGYYQTYCRTNISCCLSGSVGDTKEKAIAAWNRIQLKPEGE